VRDGQREALGAWFGMRFTSAACLSLVFAVGCAPVTSHPAVDAGVFDDAGGQPDIGVLSDAGLDASLDAGDASAVGGLTLPGSIALPYRVAGTGGSSVDVTVSNDTDVGVSVAFALAGDPLLHLTIAPTLVTARASAQLTLTFDGAATQTIATATLTASWGSEHRAIPVYAVAGDPALPVATYDDVRASDGRLCGSGTTVALPHAPFPDASGAWIDPSVRIFVPDGHRDRGAEDVVLHFHGHNTTLAGTLASQHYQEQLWASGVNALLVVPQGPVSAASGNFGKLMNPANTAALLEEVLVVLFRDGKIRAPVLDELVLTSHSGGYLAVAANAASAALPTRQIDLFDSLYGAIPTYQAFAVAHGKLRSNYTSAGGTLANNQALAATLDGLGVVVSETATFPALRDAESVIYFADTTHDRSTRLENTYAEQLRFGASHHRRGARLELRSAVASAGAATIEWLAPADADRTGFEVETSPDGVTFAAAASVGASASSATFAMTGTHWVRVRSVVTGVPTATTQASDTYVVSDAATTLVVDAFDRVLDGSYSGLAHDFAARVGSRIGASTISHRALVEDGFSLAGYTAVVWLAGDQSVDDLPISPDEQGVLTAYLASGGRLVVSGSEVAYALAGDTFLGELGAAYAADDGNALSASGVGALASVGTIAFGGATAPYPEDFPDVLSTAGAGVALLDYPTGGHGAVGLAGKAALVGFPLETVEDSGTLDALLAALLSFVGAP
jgi:hypothetical protein